MHVKEIALVTIMSAVAIVVSYGKGLHLEQEGSMMPKGARRNNYKMEDSILLLFPEQDDRRLRVNDVGVASNGLVHHLV